MSSQTLLGYIRTSTSVTIDVDSNDASIAKPLAQSKLFCDMTSNQALVYEEVVKAENSDLLQKAAGWARDNKLDVSNDADALQIIDHLTTLLGKRVYPYLTGRVHAQVSPAFADSKDKTVEHATRLVKLYGEGDNAIPKDRICIKIPANQASIEACKELEEKGIRTLATTLFSVPQAVAAHQANCLYVAPYFNELGVHFSFEAAEWMGYGKDTATKHPMAAVIRSVVLTFRKLHSKTLVMPASIVTPEEVMALVTLEPDHLTISGGVLNKMNDPQTAWSESDLAPSNIQVPDISLEELAKIDYLDGHSLREAIDADPETRQKLADALRIFDEREKLTKEFLRKELPKY